MKKIMPALGAFTLAMALLVSVAVMVAAPADAARGGKRGGGGSTTPPPTGGCTVSPNPVAANATFLITGGGYGSGQFLTLVITSSSGTSYRWVQASVPGGTFTTAAVVYTAGSNSVKVHDSVTGTLIGGCSFSSY